MALTLISTHTASADANIDITAGITSTYDSYEFHFVNIHPASDGSEFSFQVNAAGATGFNEYITSTYFSSYTKENDADENLAYDGGYDQAQGTAYQSITQNVGSDNDQSCSGMLTLYAPSSTTYVKHFVSKVQESQQNDYSIVAFAAGYINVTAAIDEISFKFSGCNMDTGTIKMFGVK